jgi:hypothetical protein
MNLDTLLALVVLCLIGGWLLREVVCNMPLVYKYIARRPSEDYSFLLVAVDFLAESLLCQWFLRGVCRRHWQENRTLILKRVSTCVVDMVTAEELTLLYRYLNSGGGLWENDPEMRAATDEMINRCIQFQRDECSQLSG